MVREVIRQRRYLSAGGMSFFCGEKAGTFVGGIRIDIVT